MCPGHYYAWSVLSFLPSRHLRRHVISHIIVLQLVQIKMLRPPIAVRTRFAYQCRQVMCSLPSFMFIVEGIRTVQSNQGFSICIVEKACEI